MRKNTILLLLGKEHRFTGRALEDFPDVVATQVGADGGRAAGRAFHEARYPITNPGAAIRACGNAPGSVRKRPWQLKQNPVIGVSPITRRPSGVSPPTTM